MANRAVKTGAERIADERATHPHRGHDAFHDEDHEVQLIEAAGSYAFEAAGAIEFGLSGDEPTTWPWASRFWKPDNDPAETLVKAGALIAAAIDEIEAERVRNKH